MTSIWELPSWSEKQLTDEQKRKYTIESVGTSTHSSRATFEVTCNECGERLHPYTNNPGFYIELHDQKCNKASQ